MIDRRDIAPGSLLAPDWCEHLLEEYGRNIHGECIFRVIWAPSRLTLMGGYWDESGEFGYRRVPKYGHKPMWGIERWLPAKHYGNYKTWVVDTMTCDGHLSIGPFPKYGEFEMTYLLATQERGYVPLLPDLVAMTVRAIWAGRINKIWDIRNALKSQDEIKEAGYDASFEASWYDTQNVRRDLSFGAGGSFNPKAKIEDKKRELLAKNIGQDAKKFRPGFGQASKEQVYGY